jgi:DNA-binding NarL/FixJ family response regulator
MIQDDARQLLAGAIAAGADGCVDKSRISTDLLAAIRSVKAGRD